jgi:hypothetical protein
MFYVWNFISSTLKHLLAQTYRDLAFLVSERYLVITSAGNHGGPCETALYWHSVDAGSSDSVRTKVRSLSYYLSGRVERSAMSDV